MGLWLVFLILLLGGTPQAQAALCRHCHDFSCPHSEQAACGQCHRGNDATRRKELAHSGLIRAVHSAYGLRLTPRRLAAAEALQFYGCRRCHQIGGTGERLATILDGVVPQRASVALEQALDQPALFMPDFDLAVTERDLLITGLLDAAQRVAPPSQQPPEVVHFAHPADEAHPFEKHCGSCHRMLTSSAGSLGGGRIGPDLSGLGGAFYPPTAREGAHWTRAALSDWLVNPRKIRPLNQMPAVRLKQQEREDLLQFFWPLGAAVDKETPHEGR